MVDRFREWRRLGTAGAFALALVVGAPALSDEVGEVSTAFKLLGANHKIVVEAFDDPGVEGVRSEEHTSELQSLMRISYAVFCLKKNQTQNNTYTEHPLRIKTQL